jgi:hypothetical protein
MSETSTPISTKSCSIPGGESIIISFAVLLVSFLKLQNIWWDINKMRAVHDIRAIIGSERIQILYSDLFQFILTFSATKAPTQCYK